MEYIPRHCWALAMFLVSCAVEYTQTVKLFTSMLRWINGVTGAVTGKKVPLVYGHQTQTHGNEVHTQGIVFENKRVTAGAGKGY